MPMTLTLLRPGFIFDKANFHFGLVLDSPVGRFALVRVLLPEGASIGWNCGLVDCAVRPDRRFVKYFHPTSESMARVSGLKQGTWEIVVEAEHNDTHEIVRESMRVEVEPIYTPKPPYKPASVIRWEATMLKEGPKWAKPTEDFGSFSWEGGVWFYDGGKVFLNIYDYAGQQLYLDSANNLLSQYADFILKKTGIAGYRVFTDGLRMYYELSREQKYADAIAYLAEFGPYARYARAVSDVYMREMSYALESMVNAELVGEPRSPRLLQCVDCLLGMVDVSIRTERPVSLQHFMLGLAMDALRKYYELTHDARIPPTVYQFLRWSKTTGWESASNKMVWKWQPDFKAETTLINLVSHIFGWYQKLTGDHEIRTHADLMFAHSLDEACWGGKMFSQMYQKSFGLVKDMYGIAQQRDGDESPFPTEWEPDYPEPVPPPIGLSPEETEGF